MKHTVNPITGIPQYGYLGYVKVMLGEHAIPTLIVLTVLMLAGGITLYIGCNQNAQERSLASKLVGTWVDESEESGGTLIFNSNGTFEMQEMTGDWGWISPKKVGARGKWRLNGKSLILDIQMLNTSGSLVLPEGDLGDDMVDFLEENNPEEFNPQIEIISVESDTLKLKSLYESKMEFETFTRFK